MNNKKVKKPIKTKKTQGMVKENNSGFGKIGRDFIQFPSKLLEPVRSFLQDRLTTLEKTKKNVSKDDPFRNSARIASNASPDTEAEEQFGHARASALREQVDRRIIQTKKALAMINIGKYGICEDCGKMIDTDRLMIYPDATLCAKDQARREK